MTDAGAHQGRTLGRVSSKSVGKATGRGWEEWLEVLDAVGAADWSHREIVAHLERRHPEVSPWWRQSLTVGYEQARGKRLVGQTADVGFQVGVQRTIAATPMETWGLITSRLELSGTGKTAIHAHLEKLPDANAREAMRRHWREALERIAAAAG